MIQNLMTHPPVRLVASESTWVEGNAIEQLKKTAQLEGIVSAAGLIRVIATLRPVLTYKTGGK